MTDIRQKNPGKTNDQISKTYLICNLSRMNEESPLGDSMTRQLPASSRFEINKVDQNLPNKFKMNDENVNLHAKSSLKKVAHRFEHDESFEESSRFIDPSRGNLSQTGCFQLNYDDEKNEPQSITCNLESTAIKTYSNCFQDLKTPGPYQKSLAEFLGTLILTLYACSIGLPISEDKVPSLNGEIFKYFSIKFQIF